MREMEEKEMKDGNGYFTPKEIANGFINIGVTKAQSPLYRLITLSLLAGAFIALAVQGSNVAIHGISNLGLQKTLAGSCLPLDLLWL